MNDVFPNFALVGPLESLLSLSTTAAVAARNCFPVSSFAHVFDEFAFGRSFDPRPVQPPQDDLVARMGAFLSVGELFAYLNEDRPAPPSAIVTQYSRTLAYAVSRADIVWPKLDKEIIFQRWFEVRRLTGWAANELLPPQKLFTGLRVWLEDKNTFYWADKVFDATPTSIDPEFAPKAASIVSENFGLALQPLPPSFDGRFEWMSTAVSRLRATSSKTEDVEFAIGLLLAALEPGELMHLNWLRLHLSHYPLAAVHYAGWSAKLSSKRIDRPDIFSGLTRRLMRDLLRPFRLEDSTIEDLSWIDLLASAESIDETSIRANAKNITISLVPGVVIGGSLQLHGEGKSENNRKSVTQPVPIRKSELPKTSTRPTQKTLFDPQKSNPNSDLLNEILDSISELRQSVAQLGLEKKAPRKSGKPK